MIAPEEVEPLVVVAPPDAVVEGGGDGTGGTGGGRAHGLIIPCPRARARCHTDALRGGLGRVPPGCEPGRRPLPPAVAMVRGPSRAGCLLYAIAGGDHCGGPAVTGPDAASTLVMSVTLPEQTPDQSPS